MSESSRPSHPQVDVGKLIERGDVDVSINTREPEGDAKVRRFKEVVGDI